MYNISTYTCRKMFKKWSYSVSLNEGELQNFLSSLSHAATSGCSNLSQPTKPSTRWSSGNLVAYVLPAIFTSLFLFLHHSKLALNLGNN